MRLQGFCVGTHRHLMPAKLEISAARLKSPAFPFLLRLSFACSLTLILLLSSLPSHLPSAGCYITWQDGVNCSNLFIPFSPIMFQCHARCVKHQIPQVHLNTHTHTCRYSLETVKLSEEVTPRRIKGRARGTKLGARDQTRTRDWSSSRILFEVQIHRPQNCIDLALLLC